MFGSPDDDIHCLSVWSKTSTALGAVCTAAFSVFAAIAAVSAFSFAAVSSLKLIAATILIGCLTFGIGFILMGVDRGLSHHNVVSAHGTCGRCQRNSTYRISGDVGCFHVGAGEKAGGKRQHNKEKGCTLYIPFTSSRGQHRECCTD